MNDAALEVRALRIESLAGDTIVNDVSFSVRAGEAVGLVGESGSGKTTTALATLGWLRPGLRLISGHAFVDGTDVTRLSASEAVRFRGKLVAYMPQSAQSALNPSMRLKNQVVEVLRHLPRGAREAAACEAVEVVGLPTDRHFLRRFPHQLSGGQQQRLALAIAIACRPKLLVLDEPTSGLDVVTEQMVLDEIDRVRKELQIAVIWISHNLALAAARAERLLVMYQGDLVEQGPSSRVLREPRETYTKSLVHSVLGHRQSIQVTTADSSGHGAPSCEEIDNVASTSPAPALQVDDLCASHKSRYDTVIAADGISFDLERGGCLAIVGESGSGKTTVARCVIGLHAPDRGAIKLDGRPLASRAKERTLEERRRIQPVFQNPFDSLNPRQTAGDAIERPLRLLHGLGAAAAKAEVKELLEKVRVSGRRSRAYPGELSGGECQRVAIARALAARPEILVCDEITSALDASVQASVLALLATLREELGLALLMISHDLGVVASVADRMIVIERGHLCEDGSCANVLLSPKHPYTMKLVAAAPSIPGALRSRAATPASGSD